MYGFVITTAGEAMLARAAAGEALFLDAVMVGRGVAESAAAAKALNTLIDPVAAATSTAPAVSGNQISMTVEYRNDLNGGLEAGFALSEFGISAHVGDDPAALLYYGSLGDAPQPVKPISEGLDVHRFPVAIAVTGEVSVIMEYPAGGFLTEEDLSRLNYIPTSEKGKPDGVATLGSDGKVPEEQLPEMDYDPAGSAEAVQENLDVHTTDKDNPHGVTAEQVGAYKKEETMRADTAALFGLGPDAVPDDVMAEAYKLIQSLQATVDGKASIATGTYTGTGTHGSSNPNTLTFPFPPKLVFIHCRNANENYFAFFFCESLTSSYTSPGYLCISATDGQSSVYAKLNDKTLSWYANIAGITTDYVAQLNTSGVKYAYTAIG